jgi:hypothetical protein
MMVPIYSIELKVDCGEIEKISQGANAIWLSRCQYLAKAWVGGLHGDTTFDTSSIDMVVRYAHSSFELRGDIPSVLLYCGK